MSNFPSTCNEHKHARYGTLVPTADRPYGHRNHGLVRSNRIWPPGPGVELAVPAAARWAPANRSSKHLPTAFAQG